MDPQILRMIAIVQMYIGVMKNVEVDIAIRNERDLVLLDMAYRIANDYFVSQGATITQVK